jgi:hypothetical protein
MRRHSPPLSIIVPSPHPSSPKSIGVTFSGEDEGREPMEIELEEFIAVKGFKAKGKRITTWKIGSIEEIEPTRLPEPEVTEEEADEDADGDAAEPVGQETPVTTNEAAAKEPEPAEKETKVNEPEPAEEEKPTEEAEPAEEEKPAQEEKPAEEEKPADEEEKSPQFKYDPKTGQLSLFGDDDM